MGNMGIVWHNRKCTKGISMVDMIVTQLQAAVGPAAQHHNGHSCNVTLIRCFVFRKMLQVVIITINSKHPDC